MKKKRKAIDWYIKGEYHCDKCPFCFGGEYMPGCDDYDDAGCYIFGDLRDSCRLIPPLRFILGWGKRKKAQYIYDHQYDDCEESYMEWESRNKKIKEAITKFLDGCDLCFKDSDGKYYPTDKEWYIEQGAYRVRCEYEDYLNELDAKKNPPQNPWKQAIVWTWRKFIGFFKPYFCK